MSAIIQQHIELPVLLIELTAPMSAEQIAETYLETIDLAMSSHSPVYRIFDLRMLKPVAALEAVAAVLMLVRNLAGAQIAPELLCAFVHPALESNPTRVIAERAFSLPEEALAYAVQQLTAPVAC